MKSKRILVVLVATVMVFSLISCNLGLALYINAKAGESYKYHVETVQTVDVKQNGQKITTNQNIAFDFIATVNEVDSEGNLTVEYKYDAMKFDMDANGINESFDSKDANSDNPMAAIYNSFIGKGFTAKMTKYGEVKEIGGVDDLLNSIVDSVDLGDDEGAQNLKEKIKESLGGSFSDEAMKSYVQSAVIFPENDGMKVGDSWTANNSIKSIIDVNMTITYTLDKIEGDTAYISVEADFKTDPSKPIEYMGMELVSDLSGTMTGDVKVNTKNGFLSEGEIIQQISGNMSLVIPAMEGIESQTLELPMESKVTITYSTTKM